MSSTATPTWSIRPNTARRVAARLAIALGRLGRGRLGRGDAQASAGRGLLAWRVADDALDVLALDDLVAQQRRPQLVEELTVGGDERVGGALRLFGQRL